MGISCSNMKGGRFVKRLVLTEHVSRSSLSVWALTWSANSTMMVYCPAPGGVYFTVNVSLSFLMMSKSMSASAGPTTPGAHLIPMLTSPAGDAAIINRTHVRLQLLFQNEPNKTNMRTETWPRCDLDHLTLPGLAAVHREVCRLVGLQSRLLHTWTVNLHVLWVAAFSDRHLVHEMQRCINMFKNTTATMFRLLAAVCITATAWRRPRSRSWIKLCSLLCSAKCVL